VTTTSNITITGRIDPDSYLDLALAAKAKGWDITGGGGYRAKSGSLSLIVVATIPDGCNERDLVKELWDLIPTFDGVILSSEELNSLSDFVIDDDGAESAEESKWW
jgi:hypothetical protein